MALLSFLVHGAHDQADQRVRGILHQLFERANEPGTKSTLEGSQAKVILLGQREMLEDLGCALLSWLELWSPAMLDRLYLRYIEGLEDATSWATSVNLLQGQREWAHAAHSQDHEKVMAIILIEPLTLCDPNPGSTGDMTQMSRLLASLIELAHDLKISQAYWPQLWITDTEEKNSLGNPFLHLYHTYLTKVMAQYELIPSSSGQEQDQSTSRTSKGDEEEDQEVWDEGWEDFIPWSTVDVGKEEAVSEVKTQGTIEQCERRSPSF